MGCKSELFFDKKKRPLPKHTRCFGKSLTISVDCGHFCRTDAADTGETRLLLPFIMSIEAEKRPAVKWAGRILAGS